MKEGMISLATLQGGAAVERFDDELEKVLSNIMDPNTAPSAREITLKVKITPNEDRNFCTMQIQCSSKVAAAKTFETHIFIGQDAHGVKATEHNPNQMTLPLEKKTAELRKVV